MKTHLYQNRAWSTIASVAVFLLYALTYIVPSGYSYGAVLLFLTSLGYLTTKPNWKLSAEDKALIYIFLSIFIIALVAFIIHSNEPKTVDQASRYLLFVPILLLLLKMPPHQWAIWAGIAVGSISAAAFATWQRYGLGIDRPDGFMTSAIPFGDISLMAGILCLPGMFWANAQTTYTRAWRILAVGFLAGLYTSILSGSRGGWLAIPLVIVLLCIAFLKRKGLKQTIISIVLVIAALGVVFTALQDKVIARYDIAVIQINDYAQHRDANTSVGIRLEAWRAAVINIAERPILGWSYKDYAARLQELAAEKKTSQSITELANTHNNYLEVWLHQGIFGLLALLAMFIVPFWFFCKRLRSPNANVQALAVGGASLLVSFFIFGLTQVILGRNNGVIFFGLSLVIFWACMRNEEKKAAEQLSNTPVSQQ
ncbi:O-antigen ligase family protein [Eoetvoesiella caeni]|uniref:O-antigen ligase n=1 Tax=Eoetvoesiella caeni TaxID=645616 RepID=A0A366HJ57_9BURK|nr:O-antigen ligase family protein [Eoetvoesiella caeni]MCI2807815.1 O-antigen ligase family protein [Eoetvoesiella caeni]NYT54183.1 O-antigen ligase family protein [Eoetvoesiella caeni]RBP41730.1 O-antigen ligase [Eoetvoesiella caeni]